MIDQILSRQHKQNFSSELKSILKLLLYDSFFGETISIPAVQKTVQNQYKGVHYMEENRPAKRVEKRMRPKTYNKILK